jgi:hypothetical protein
VGNFITDAMVILPYLKIYHKNEKFWKIYREFLENLP